MEVAELSPRRVHAVRFGGGVVVVGAGGYPEGGLGGERPGVAGGGPGGGAKVGMAGGGPGGAVVAMIVPIGTLAVIVWSHAAGAGAAR